MNDNCTWVGKWVFKPRDWRYHKLHFVKTYQILWTIFTVYVPFAALLLLNGKILMGLRKVKNRSDQ